MHENAFSYLRGKLKAVICSISENIRRLNPYTYDKNNASLVGQSDSLTNGQFSFDWRILEPLPISGSEVVTSDLSVSRKTGKHTSFN